MRERYGHGSMDNGVALSDGLYYFLMPPRYIEAGLLRRSGLTYKEIGKRLGVCTARARDMNLRFERGLHNSKATKRDQEEWIPANKEVAKNLLEQVNAMVSLMEKK